jgi:hypothetical protein
MSEGDVAKATAPPGGLRLLRWTVTTSSASASRGAAVLTAGDHQWEATADGGGAISALFGAVDAALEPVLGGRARLVSFDIHALGEGIDAEGAVELAVEPPAGAAEERAHGRYAGRAHHRNIVAASVEAYIVALQALLSDEAWQGATEAAGNLRRASVRAQAARSGARATLAEDEEEGPGPRDWFER